MELAPLHGVVLGTDLAVHAEFEQGLELLLDPGQLPLELDTVETVAVALGVHPSPDHVHEPLASRGILDADGGEEREDLIVDPLLGHTQTRMIALGVLRAVVVRVRLHGAVGRAFEDLLTRHHVPAVGAADQAASEGDLGFAEDTPREAVLHGLEGAQVDQGLERARVPDALEARLADIVPVGEDAVERGASEAGPAIRMEDSLPGQGLAERVERERLVGEELEDALDLGGVDRIGLDDAPAVDADAAQAEDAPQREARLDAALQARPDVGTLLVGLVGGEDRRHAPLHATGGGFSRGLVGEEERHARHLGELLEISPVTDVAGRAIDLHEEHAVKRPPAALDEGGELAERGTLLPLAGGLGDLEELDDLAAQAARELDQASLLILEAEALLPLLRGTNPGPGDELLHATLTSRRAHP